MLDDDGLHSDSDKKRSFFFLETDCLFSMWHSFFFLAEQHPPNQSHESLPQPPLPPLWRAATLRSWTSVGWSRVRTTSGNSVWLWVQDLKQTSPHWDNAKVAITCIPIFVGHSSHYFGFIFRYTIASIYGLIMFHLLLSIFDFKMKYI